MTELKEILTRPQRVKHHDLLQFLTSHPNVTYSIEQLDFLLPRGAALQRFPEEWFGLMARGECGNRNIELFTEDGDSKPDPLSPGSPFSRPLPDRTFLICRRPELQSLKELQQLLNTPAMMPDPEECVGLHTDQVILSRNLLRDCQRSGLAFYFPDRFVKREAVGAAGTGGGGGGDPDGGVSSSPTAAVESLLSQRQLLSEISGVPTVVVALPLGVRIRHKLFTWRGIAISDAHCFPIRLHLRERLLVTFDNENAVLRQIPGGKDGLLVRWSIVVPGRASGISTSTAPPSASSIEPLSIRSRSITSERMVPITFPTAAENASSELNIHKTVDKKTIRYTRVQMDIEALSAVPLFKLIFIVNGLECIVNMEVVDVDTNLPGVLIGREREPSGFSLPPSYRLMDPAILGNGVASAQFDVMNTQQKGINSAEPSADGEPYGTVSATVRPSSSTNTTNKAAYDLLPWWQNSSPLVLGVRDATYPMEESVNAATGVVYSQRALLHEARLRAVRHLMIKKMEGGKQDRRRMRRKSDLRNRHMLHFGLDASVPFSLKRDGV